MPVEFDPARRKFIQSSLGAGVGLFLFRPTEPSDLEPEDNDKKESEPTDEFSIYLSELVRTIPDISGDEKYDIPLNAGVGYSTLHCLTREAADNQGKFLTSWMDDRDVSEEQLTPNQKNIFQLTRNGIKGISNFIDARQDDLEIATAISSNQYVGLVATRSPADIGAKYLVFSTTSQERLVTPPKFVGIVLVVDCVQREHWLEGGSTRTYSYLGWKNLPWITEASPEVMEKFPPGVSGDPKNINCGRPGVVLVSERVYNSFTVSNN